MVIDKLYEKAKKNTAVCLGLDTKEDFLPDYIKEKDMSLAEKYLEFNKKIINATKNDVACYKVQIACYEALGLEGLKCYSETLKYIKKTDNIAIADVKRGDISSTAQMYATGHFSGDFEADFITVNTYMGEDAISPYFDYVKNNEKGIFALVKTSNKLGYQIQDLKCEDESLVYENMAKLVDKWGSEFMGKCGYSSIGAVVGLTYPKEFENIKSIMKNTFFLIPGYGAQGGTGKDIANIFKDGICGVVNSSRGIIASHKGKVETENFTDITIKAVNDIKEDINQWLK